MSICSVNTIVSVRSPEKITKPKPNIMKHVIAEEDQPSTTDKKSLGSKMNFVYVTGLTNNNNIAYSGRAKPEHREYRTDGQHDIEHANEIRGKQRGHDVMLMLLSFVVSSVGTNVVM